MNAAKKPCVPRRDLLRAAGALGTSGTFLGFTTGQAYGHEGRHRGWGGTEGLPGGGSFRGGL